MNKSARVLSSKAHEFAGQIATIKGWVRIRRDHGKLIFLDIRDRNGIIQVVVNPRVSEEAHKVAQELRPEYVVEISGNVNKRPENAINKDIVSSTIEIEALEIKILAKAQTLPFDTGEARLNLELPTLLDHRSLTLRQPQIAEIFKVQEEVAT